MVRTRCLDNSDPVVNSMSASSNWSNPLTEPRLGDNEIHFWRAFRNCETTVLQCLEACLTPDEKTRAARFKFHRGRAHFIAARRILRVILGTYIHRDAATVTLTYEPEGKPGLKPVGQESSIEAVVGEGTIWGFHLWDWMKLEPPY